MKMWLLILMLAVFGYAQAYDVKGVKLGTSLADLKAQVSHPLDCSKLDKNSSSAKIELLDEACRPTGKNPLVWAQDSFAGYPANLLYFLHKGMLWKVRIFLPASSFDDVVATLTTKFGVPIITHSEWKNAMGATLDNPTAAWQNGDVIVYKKYQQQLDLGSDLSFYSSEAWQAISTNLKAKTEAASQDL
ncbi:MAG: hypothetical protein JSR27_02280 [Proteobacteria bacterium]|nr:hypothetical protein [Pseudomonadota bacterium]